MSDIKCAMCGEPWDAYGVRSHGDMNYEEADRFLRGEGCPCCRIGSICSFCDGLGIQVEHVIRGSSLCDICHGKSIVWAWSPCNDTKGYKADALYTGYYPNVRRIDEAIDIEVTIGVRKFPERMDQYVSADGPIQNWIVACPNGCKANENSCSCCNGTGKLTSNPDLELEACESELDASDEEPIGIIKRRGLL